MRLFRSPALLRLVAAFLVGGLGGTIAPTALAQGAREASIRSLLNNDDAFERALAAAHAPEAAADPVGAFADAYADAVGGNLTAQVVRDLLDGQAFGLVAPVVPDPAFVPASVTVAPGHGALLGVLPASVGTPRASRDSILDTEAAPAVSRPEADQSRPRAP